MASVCVCVQCHPQLCHVLVPEHVRHYDAQATHRADFQLVTLQGLQPHQGPDAPAHQDFFANMVFQDVAEFFGISCMFVRN